jgi:hypothetical protein
MSSHFFYSATLGSQANHLAQHDLYGFSNITDCYWNAVNGRCSEHEMFLFWLEKRELGGDSGEKNEWRVGIQSDGGGYK